MSVSQGERESVWLVCEGKIQIEDLQEDRM